MRTVVAFLGMFAVAGCPASVDPARDAEVDRDGGPDAALPVACVPLPPLDIASVATVEQFLTVYFALECAYDVRCATERSYPIAACDLHTATQTIARRPDGAGPPRFDAAAVSA